MRRRQNLTPLFAALLLLAISLAVAADWPRRPREAAQEVAATHRVYLPLVLTSRQLANGDFETDWAEGGTHRAYVLPAGGAPYWADIENVFTPPGWAVWFVHEPGRYDQPEGRYTSLAQRVHSERQAYQLFTFYRGHWAGLLRRQAATPGARLRFTAWAHAWSNSRVPGYEHYGDARCSVGVGCGPVCLDSAPPLNGDPLNDAIGNFTFRVGIDPTGGSDPLAASVVWGAGRHVYNGYACPLAVEAVAQAETVTLFVESRTLWAFENSDAYFDDAALEVVDG